jgi:hypothetical protein
MKRVWLLVLCFLYSIGCGHVDDPEDPGSALWTLNCKITDIQNGLSTDNLRVALIWADELGPSNGVALLSRDLPITPKFPVQFSLGLYDPPPDETLIEGKDQLAGIEISVGILMVYDDRNQNRKLDILSLSAQEPIDYLLGPAEQYRLVYTTGEPTSQNIDGLFIETGMNLFLLEGYNATQKIPLDSILDVTLVDSSMSQHMMCKIPPGYTASVQELGEVAHSEIPDDASINCQNNGYSLEFSYTKWLQDGVCGDINEVHYSGSSQTEVGQPVPDGWPCPIN